MAEIVKCALVTGSSNGIGEAIVKELAKLNYKLIVTGRNEKDIKRVAEECCILSPSKLKPLEIVANLDNENEVDELFNKSIEFFENKLHLLVNNAGYGEPIPHTKVDDCYKAYKKIMSININSTVRLTLLASKYLKKTSLEINKPTSIINISSIASLRPSLTLFAYATSKAALNMFSDSMAIELAPNVRVNCILPGPIETKIIERSGFKLNDFKNFVNLMTPLKRIGQVDEVASCVLFLADSDKASYITGANLIVDGGTNLATNGLSGDNN